MGAASDEPGQSRERAWQSAHGANLSGQNSLSWESNLPGRTGPSAALLGSVVSGPNKSRIRDTGTVLCELRFVDCPGLFSSIPRDYGGTQSVLRELWGK